MNHLALNLLLAIVWVLLHAEFSLRRLVVGFLAGFAAIALTERALGRRHYSRAAAGVLALSWSFLWELVLSSLTLARDILRPRPVFHPAFVRLDVRDLSPVQTILLACLITLTPGTLTVDVGLEEQALYIHSLYARDPAELGSRLRRFVHLIQRAAGRALPLSPEQ
ncbi:MULTISPECIES: Na+/H+ antiporter subunit E [Sorangium]|uniref:Cation:proton antiporter n=1 Tax=Sorangium cellulosum TaxID=56 RepID=A0A4P2QHN8_SORCE|nr:MULTISPECIES: Na+/H+ antiporter subunit E [Sorangium]AUX29051.1 cation:proton antiporter [Sorangium cellulosum]WCQ88441.1 Na(+)/H(+) antiporter subunit E1 [Sorangium sp. Soce836]